MNITKEELTRIIQEELAAVLSEGEGKKDACYHKVRARYDVWPSAYASGALVKCRKVGAKNWGNSKKNEEVKPEEEEELKDVSKQLDGAVKAHSKLAKTIKKVLKNEEDQKKKEGGKNTSEALTAKTQKVFLAKHLVKLKERLQGQVENTKVKKSNQKSMVVLHDNTWKQYTRNTDQRMRS